MSGMDAAVKTLGFGRVDQLGLVVRDLEAAVRNMSAQLGVRDWYRPAKSEKGGFRAYYKGKEVTSDIDFVFGYCGKIQIELVTSSGGEDIYTKFMEEHGEGMHHLCFFVSDMDAKLAAFRKLGMEPVQYGDFGGKSGAVTRFAYLDNTLSNGLTIEMTETKLFGIHTPTTPLIMKLGAMTGDLVKVKF